MSSRRWGNVSYLDAIRPEPAWKTEFALLASYSADLVALVAALLALAGLDDDRGSGSKVDFATAIDQLAGRVRLLVQAGRLVAPAKPPRILTILDRYVREVQLDESIASWHPKVALAKHVPNDGPGVEWRLWIGSRNLTRDLAWDVGLTFVGRAAGPGSDIPGLIEVAEALAQHAQLPGVSPRQIRSELHRVRWTVPAGCSVRAVRLLTPEGSRGLPLEPDHVDRLIVVSPFLDGTVIGELGKWGADTTQRTLVSSRAELAKLAVQASRPLSRFNELLFLDAPVAPEQTALDSSEREDANSQDEEPEPRALHAKIIYAEAGSRRWLWTGSANATQRGWKGPNREIVADLEVSADVAEGLLGFITETAKTVRLEELGNPEPTSAVEDRLEAARKHVAATWDVQQHIADLIPRLTAETNPNPPDKDVELAVGLLSSSLVVWPRGAEQIELPPIVAADTTELILCRLSLEEVSVSWLQRAPLSPAPNEERDRQALVRYLDPRTFLQWIRSLLTGEPDGEGGGEWDGGVAIPTRRRKPAGPPHWWSPTMEEVLRSWSRDPVSLGAIDRKIHSFLKLYQDHSDTDLPAVDRAVVEKFHRTWQILRQELVEGS